MYIYMDRHTRNIIDGTHENLPNSKVPGSIPITSHICELFVTEKLLVKLVKLPKEKYKLHISVCVKIQRFR